LKNVFFGFAKVKWLPYTARLQNQSQPLSKRNASSLPRGQSLQ